MHYFSFLILIRFQQSWKSFLRNSHQAICTLFVFLSFHTYSILFAFFNRLKFLILTRLLKTFSIASSWDFFILIRIISMHYFNALFQCIILMHCVFIIMFKLINYQQRAKSFLTRKKLFSKRKMTKRFLLTKICRMINQSIVTKRCFAQFRKQKKMKILSK